VARSGNPVRGAAGGVGALLHPETASPRLSGDGTLALALPEAVRLRSEISKARGRGWLLHRLLLVADVSGLALAFFLGQLIFVPEPGTPYAVSPDLQWLVFVLSLPIWVAIAQLSGLYGRDGQRADHSTVDDFVGIFSVITIGAWLYSAAVWVTHAVQPNPPRMIAFWLMAIGFVLCGRALARAVARRSPMFTQNAVIVGAGDVGQLIALKLQQHPEYAIRLVGFVDDEPREPREDLRDVRLLASTSRLPELVETYDIDRVIIAYSHDPHEELLKIIHKLKAISVQIDLVPRLFEAVGPRVDMHTVETVPLIGLPPVRLSPAARAVKRVIDIVLATFTLVLTAPLFAYIVWRIKRDSPGSAFFRQTRIGLNMREFTVLKFRTMRVGVDNTLHREYIKTTMSPEAPVGGNGLYKLERPGDITPFGRWLRKTSLDELPQLLNVVKGEMSLVGPRPCIAYETEHFAPHHFERFLVQPGMTGLWQVAARARSTFGEALDMDVAYARAWSLGLDLRLLCRTPLEVLRHRSTT
jgi:exopolysaccharide biosynthesis polyprenyl glycosylphosphotransferase